MSTFHYPTRTNLAKILRDLLARVRRLEAIPARAVYEIKLFADPVWPDTVALVRVGDTRFMFPIDSDLDGAYLLDVEGAVTTPGTVTDVTVQVRNWGDGSGAGTNMLTTPLTIDAGTRRSCDSATPVVIDPLNDQVAACDLICLDVDTAPDDAKGLAVKLTFGGF